MEYMVAMAVVQGVTGAKMIKTDYLSYSYRTENRYGEDSLHFGVKKIRYIGLPTNIRIAVCSLTVMIYLALAVVTYVNASLPLIFLLFLAAILSFAIIQIVGFSKRFRSEIIHSGEVAKNLKDECMELAKTYANLRKAAKMSPEGSGIHERTHEYGRLVFEMLSKLGDLKVANELVNGRGNDFYTSITAMKTKVKDLDSSGTNLIELVASKRIDNITEDLRFLGTDQFIDAVSMETMAYRSLNEGEKE